ncbi:MAG: conjugal transfer protein TraX [Ruminococcus sp.]|jgi:hypothetical protein|nr:conjugal transfer protein TraX [Ruminococcus sp.]
MIEARKSGGVSAEIVKYIAAAAMVLDHIAIISFGSQYGMPLFILKTLGRIAMPVFSYFIVEGFYRTKNVNRYMSRMLLFAVISYVPFILMMRGTDINGNWLLLNQLFSFFFGLLFLDGIHNGGRTSSRIIIAVVAAIGICFCQYGFFGLAVIIAFDIMHHNKKYGLWAYAAVIFTTGYRMVLSHFSTSYTLEILTQNVLTFDFFARFCVEFLGYFIPLLMIVNIKESEKRPNKFNKWFFYIFYPLHLAILAYIKYNFIMVGMPKMA